MPPFSIEAFLQGAHRAIDTASANSEHGREAARAYLAETLRTYPPGEIIAALDAAIPPGADIGEMIVHQGDGLTLLFARVPPHFRSAVHNHTVCAIIGQLSGAEVSAVYEEGEDGQLREARRMRVTPGEVMVLDKDAIHHIENPNATPSCSLHLYAGDFSAIAHRRSLWTGEALEQQAFSFPALLKESVAAMKRDGNADGLSAIKAAVPAAAALVDAA